MSPEEIMQAYDVLVQEGNDYAAREAARVGNSQRSIGGLAEVVANPSGQTSGLANYTYNRVMRPTVDSLAAALTTTGKSQAMDRYLKDELMAAKSRYDDAKNNYTTASTSPSNNNSGTNGYREQNDEGYPVTKNENTPAGVIISTGTSGDGVYDVVVADGNGGFNRYQYFANSSEEAKQKYWADHGHSTGSSGWGRSGEGLNYNGGGGGW